MRKTKSVKMGLMRGVSLGLIIIVVLLGVMFLKLTPAKLHDRVLQEYGLQDNQIQVNGLTVYYQTVGDPTNPPFVALHGWGGKHEKTFENRAKWMKTLADNGYFVIAPEHPGLARSQTPPSAWSNNDYAQHIHNFLQQLKVEKPIVHGQSFGGMIALTYAANYPDDLKALVLTDSAIPKSKIGGQYLRAAKPLGELFTWSMKTNLIPKFLKRELVMSVLSVPADFSTLDNFSERAVMGEVLSGQNNKAIDLPNIKTPTLLFWGKHDWTTPVSLGEFLDREIPNSKLTIFKGGHLMLYSHLNEIIGKILALEGK